MGGCCQSKPDTILREPSEDVNKVYTIHHDEFLGCGIYGMAYRCTEISTDRLYACKKIRKMRSEADHIRREVEIMQRLSGRRNIVGFESVREDKEYVYIVMELCEGGQLKVNRRYDEPDAAIICKQILEAVHACHSDNMMHGDVKPQNLLFFAGDHNDDALLKLTDFGLSAVIEEAWMDEGPIDLETDPWPDISPAAKDLLRKMLNRNPKERITAARALEHPWITANYDEGEQ